MFLVFVLFLVILFSFIEKEAFTESSEIIENYNLIDKNIKGFSKTLKEITEEPL
jgi:hypothetical protein